MYRGGGGFVLPLCSLAAVAFGCPVCCSLGSEPERMRGGPSVCTGLDWHG